MIPEKQHILLDKAVTGSRFNGDLSPAGCIYDTAIGAWVVADSGNLLAQTVGRARPKSKKSDLETGEDRKGD